MMPDDLRLSETQAWLDRSRRDLRAARLLIAGDGHGEALFHCQQAIEKALKGFLALHQKPFRKTHVIGELIPGCLAIDSSLQPALEHADAFSQYAWRFRYPGAPYEPDVAEATSALQTAEAIVREIERRLT